jgi:hypothetical protein
MQFGWKVLIPFGLLWVMVTGLVVVIPQEYGNQGKFLMFAVMCGTLALALLLAPLFSRAGERSRKEVGA